MAKSFDDLVERTTSKRTRARASRRTQQLLSELLVSELRELTGRSQTQLARELGIRQPSLSKLEKQPDMQLSTLRRIVEALGGELDLVARFPQGAVKIRPFDRPSRRVTPARRKAAARSAGSDSR